MGRGLDKAALSASQVADLQCYLAVTATNQLTLFPWEGGNIIVNGSQRQIPQAGVIFNGTGAASTLYYVYLTDLMTLALSTVAPTIDAFGRRVSGTSRLVGWVCTAADGTLVDSATQRFCRSVGDKGVFGTNVAATLATSTTPFTLVAPVSYLAIAGEAVNLLACFDNVQINSTSNYARFGICDGPGLTAPTVTEFASGITTIAGSNIYQPGFVSRSFIAGATGVRTTAFSGHALSNGVYTATFQTPYVEVATAGVR